MRIASILVLLTVPTAITVAQTPQSCPVSTPSQGRWFGSPDLKVDVTGNWSALPRWDAFTMESALGLASGSLPWRNIPGWQAGYRHELVWQWDGYDPHADPTPPLEITGRRLDGIAPPLMADTNKAGFNGNGSGIGSFVTSGIVFPATGCWEITGKLRDKQLIFVVFVGDSGNNDTDLLLRAIIHGDMKTVEALLSAGLDPNQRDSAGRNPLNWALIRGNQQIAVSLLLKWHADPNQPLDNIARNDRYPLTPILYAVNSRDLQLISLLLDNGAHIDTKGPGGRTALHLAVAGGCPDTLQVLPAKGAPGDCPDILQFLLGKGADPNLRDLEGASPLDDAVWRGSAEEVAMLLAHGAHLNDPDVQTGATPINEAAFRGNAQVVQLLLQLHPDLEIPDKRGYTPLDNAIRMRKEDAALLLLNAEPMDRLTPAFLDKVTNEAVSKDEVRLTEALLGKGVSVNSTLSSGSTPLGAAAFAGAVNVVRFLLERSANPNLADSDGAAPLWIASLKGYDAVAGTLLDHGAAVNRLNTSSATTALYEAASLGQEKVVKLLLDRGADTAICGTNRKSPYQAALANGYRNLAIQIQNHGGATGCKQ